jgi:hypothetical protein
MKPRNVQLDMLQHIAAAVSGEPDHPLIECTMCFWSPMTLCDVATFL